MVFANVVIGTSARTGTRCPEALSRSADRRAHNRVGGGTARARRRAVRASAREGPQFQRSDRQITSANKASEMGPQTRGLRSLGTMSGYSTDRRAGPTAPSRPIPGLPARLVRRHPRGHGPVPPIAAPPWTSVGRYRLAIVAEIALVVVYFALRTIDADRTPLSLARRGGAASVSHRRADSSCSPRSRRSTRARLGHGSARRRSSPPRSSRRSDPLADRSRGAGRALGPGRPRRRAPRRDQPRARR